MTVAVEQILKTENQFIMNLFSVLCIPQRTEDDDEDDSSEETPQSHKQVPVAVREGTQAPTRAKSLLELQQRLETIKNKKGLSYREKLMKKSLKNIVKKKNKNMERKKLVKDVKNLQFESKNEENPEERKPNGESKPVFNSGDKMMFSKIDFSDIGVKKKQREEKDPQKILENLNKHIQKVTKLQESGEVEKATRIKEKSIWKSALAKAEGKKVKDDPTLLKKTIKKSEQKHRSSQKKWQARQEGVKKAKEERQNKRVENIQKRKNDKKKNKLKKAAKKGKIIPGY